MTIIYAPDGMPWEVPDSEIKNFARKGYRTSAPQRIKQVIPTLVVEPVKEQSVHFSQPIVSQSMGLNINTASLKDLSSLPGVTTAIARKVMSDRPYSSVEDLIAKSPDIDWVSIPDLVFENASI